MSNSTKLDNATLSLFQNTDASIGISAIYIIITVVNLAGNGLSMCLLVFCTSPKTPSIIFMINLTFTDLAVGAALPFQIIYLLQGYNWTLGSSMCRIVTVVFFTNMYCSILTMTAISIDRYLGIVRPMLYRQTKEMKCIPILVCLGMWALVLVVLYPLMTTDHTYHFPDLGITTCFDMLKKDMLPSKTAWAAFIFTLVFLLFLLPFFITTFCYIRVIRKLSRDAKTDQKDRAIRLMVIVLLVFTLCFAPNNILLIAHTVRRLFYGDSLYMAYKLSLTFSCLNSCLDPIIYYLASKEFRQKLRKMLRLSLNSTSETPGRLEHRESLFSTQYATEGHEADHAKMSGKTHASSL